MTCAECRETFSARVDDALGADARATLEQHLAGCAECRREWQRFAATVDLLHAVQPERAPAGFVDRVLAAARPQPWYRRALRGLFVPWPVKLPLEAAALVLVAGLAVMIFQRSPELRQAAVSPPALVSAPEQRSYDMLAPVEAPARPSAAAKSAKTEVIAAQETKPAAPDTGAFASREMADARRPESAPPAMAQPPQQPQELMLARRQQQQYAESPAPPPTAAAAAPPAKAKEKDEGFAPPAEERTALSKKLAPQGMVPPAATPGARGRSDAVALSAPPPLVASVAAPRVELRLTVADRVAAARDIAAVVTRLGGTMLPRRDTGGLEMTVPRDAYPTLARELGRLGTLAVVAQPRELPEPVPVGVTLTE